MPKVDPETHQMIPDFPDHPDPSARGAMREGDPDTEDRTPQGHKARTEILGSG